MEISKQARTNAAISYFFLGPLFLLASGNPNFAHPFVREHAKSASKAVFAYLAIIVAYSMYVKEYLSFPLPIVSMNAGRVVTGLLFLMMFFALIRGAYLAHNGLPAAGIFDFLSRPKKAGSAFETGALSETERNFAAVSFVPVLGIAIAVRHPNPVTGIGARFSTLFFFLYVVLITSGGDAFPMFLTLAYAVFFVAVAVSLISRGELPMSETLSKIPSMDEAYRFVRATFRFIGDSVSAAFWKTEELSFRTSLSKTAAADAAFESVMEMSFPEHKSAISPKIVAIPVANLLFLPRLFSSTPFRYAIAAGQGIALTIIFAALVYFYGVGSPYHLFLLPAIVALYANAESNPFLRIPVLYEIYALFGAITFGLANRARDVHEVSKKETSVSFKV